MNLKKVLTIAGNILYGVITTSFTVILLYFLLKIFVYDTYPVNSHSMWPAIQPGDKIFVNKTIIGPRVYKNLKFMEGGELETFRLPGMRRLAYNDIVVFNYTVDEDWYRTSFHINGVYVKRCVGMPGDTIFIRNGIYEIPGVKDTLGLYGEQLRHQNTDYPDELLHAYPFDHRVGWTIKEFGPLYLPRKGDTISLNEHNTLVYRKYIKYETGEHLRFENGHAYMGETIVTEYVFRNSYYFMSGDNIADSRDSRYFGVIPEDFIIGVVSRVLYSRPHKDNRILKKL